MREDEDNDDGEEGREGRRVLAKEQPRQYRSVILDRVARRPSKPNAYNYYQKLVQDFQSLDNELQAAATVQEQLHSKVDHLQAHHQTSINEQLAAQQKQWERERELQIETIVRKSDEVESLHSKVDELDALELRLLAEIQVLQEKQQEEIRTEAFRINELVHEKTHLFEAELAKGRMDLEYIAQVVKKTHSLHNHDGDEERESAHNKELIHAIAEEIQQRRRRDFELAAENLNARLLSFEQEKETLSKKANDIRTHKQRALQILSTNQQQAIKTFFSSAPRNDSDTNKKNPSEQFDTSALQLDFSSILEALNQSGSQVGQIQSARNEKMSARKSMEDALQEAQATLAIGEKRIEALQRTISSRKKDAKAFHISPRDSSIVYDGKFGIESYPPAKYELAYFIRGVVFEWVNRAVVEAESEPATQLLAHEIQSWEVAHSAVEQEGNLRFRVKCAMSELASIINEIIYEVATDIHSEFQSSCSRVSQTIGSVFHDVFFASAKPSGIANSKPSANAGQVKNASSSSSVLASAMFNRAYEQMQIVRKQQTSLYSEQTSESVRYLHLMMQPKKIAAAISTTDNKALQAASTESPKKKWLGFFSSNKQSKETPLGNSTSINAVTKERSVDQKQLWSNMGRNAAEVIQLQPEIAEPPKSSSSTSIAADKQFWQQMVVETTRVVVPSSFAHSSCVEVASDASFCVLGTVTGELLVYDLYHQPPLLLRSHALPPKSTKTSISRIVISANKTRIITRNQLKVVHVWSVNRVMRSSPIDQQQLQLSSEGFAMETPQKWKSQPLDLLMELNSDYMVQPALPVDVKQWIQTAKPSAVALPAQFLCANWFPSTSLLGEQTSLICGHSSGDILKYNMGAGSGQNKPTSYVSDPETAAKFDAPLLSDLTNGLSFKDIKREFFCGHKHPVLFIKCFQSSKSNSRVELLSIDSDANVLEWECDPAQFSGFGWFTPVRRYHIDLQTTINSTEKQQGEILQVAATADEKQVVLMVFFENQVAKKSSSSSSSSGKLWFYQLRLPSEPIQIAPVLIQLDFTGNSPPPRFALSTVCPSSKGKKKGGGSSGLFLFLLMNNSVQIISLSTGENCCAPISLHQKNDTSLVFNAISVSERCLENEKVRCCMVVSGEHHNKFLVYRFKQQQ